MNSSMLSIAEAAQLLAVSQATLRRLIRTGAIRAVNVGARIVLSPDEVGRVSNQGAGNTRRKEKRSTVGPQTFV